MPSSCTFRFSEDFFRLSAIATKAPAFRFRHSWKRCKDLGRATGILVTVSLVLSGFSKGISLSSVYYLDAAWLAHPCTRHLEKDVDQIHLLVVLEARTSGQYCQVCSIRKEAFLSRTIGPEGCSEQRNRRTK